MLELVIEGDRVMVSIDRQDWFATQELDETVSVLVPPFQLALDLVG